MSVLATHLERPLYPVTGALLGVLVFVLLSRESGIVNAAALYSAILSLAAMVVGFLAAFYLFLVSAGSVFMQAIKRTAAYRRLVSLVWSTMIGAIILCGLTIAMAALEPNAKLDWSVESLLVFSWSVLAGYVFASSVRCLYLFRRSVGP